MEPIYTQEFLISDDMVDRYGRLKPSAILFIAQEMGGRHSALMSLDYDTLAGQCLFWAVTRHRVQVERMPQRGETIRVETWPLPATRVAYPRSVIAYDSDGNECFRVLTLWVLMNLDTRQMVLPGKSGIQVEGLVRGNELTAPGGLIRRPLTTVCHRRVCFSDLDRNGHMNNTRCLDWIADLLPSEFHAAHSIRDIIVCYQAEAMEQEELQLNLEFLDENSFQVDSSVPDGGEGHRVFSVRVGLI